MLSGRNFVVLGLGENAELPQLLVQLLHKRGNAWLDRAEIVVVQLLPLRCTCAEQRSAGVNQILAAVEHILVHKEVLLLWPHRRLDARHIRIAEEMQHAERLTVDCLHRAQERGLLIKRLAAVGAEDGRNAEHAVLDERIRGCVPRGVASRLKGGTQTARRERRGIRLALDEFFAGEFHDDLAAVLRRNETVMLLCRDAGHRLKPVREMRCAAFDRPILHRIGDDSGNLDVEVLSLFDRLLKRTIGLFRKPRFHGPVVKNH